MPLFITTSRKPSPTTRRLARWLSLLLGGKSENRGKRGVAEIGERGLKAGFERVLFVYESHGNPDELAFLQDGGWLDSIAVRGVELPSLAQKEGRLPGLARGKALDAEGERVLDLLLHAQVEAVEGAGAVEVVAGGLEIAFQYRGKKVGPVIKIAGIRPAPKNAENAVGG